MLLACDWADGLGADGDLVFIWEKRDCSSLTGVGAGEGDFSWPIPNPGTETPAFARRDVAS